MTEIVGEVEYNVRPVTQRESHRGCNPNSQQEHATTLCHLFKSFNDIQLLNCGPLTFILPVQDLLSYSLPCQLGPYKKDANSSEPNAMSARGGGGGAAAAAGGGGGKQALTYAKGVSS